jgi:hypothetical protein
VFKQGENSCFEGTGDISLLVFSGNSFAVQKGGVFQKILLFSFRSLSYRVFSANFCKDGCLCLLLSAKAVNTVPSLIQLAAVS